MVVALDLGNVCVSIDPEAFFKAINAVPEDYPELVLKHELVETGKYCEDEFFADVVSSVPKVSDIDFVRDAFNSIIQLEMVGMAEFVEFCMKVGIEVVALSDTSPCHLALIQQRLSFAKYFSGWIVSFEVGERKPSLAMYRNLEDLFGKPVLFTDDRQENISGAKSAGWHAVLFSNAKDLLEELKGLLV